MPKNYEKLAESLQHENDVLKAKNKKLMRAAIEISNMCIGDFVFDKRLDANAIGDIIYTATGLTNPQLNILDA